MSTHTGVQAPRITTLIKKVADAEGLSPQFIRAGVSRGTIVIPANATHNLAQPTAIGTGLRTKINANLGTSTDESDLAAELQKLSIAVSYGADTVMDLSVGGDLANVRKTILAHSAVPVGTVPVYEIAVDAQRRKGGFLDFTGAEVLAVLERQAAEGVDFFTIHAGVTKESLAALKKKKRLIGIVSRGGAFLARWIAKTKKENPFYEYYDRILEIAAAYGVTLSLGDGLRPGSILDATDAGQIAELRILGRLAARARAKGVQVMIEGPGHVPLDQIKQNVQLEKKLCHGAPFYVLGPLVTDVAAGYDHITSAIGGALAASYGADFLCYVTPAEHLRHPSCDDVRDGVVAARIAAHAADVAKGLKSALEWDKKMTLARSRRDWQAQVGLSVDPRRAGEYRRTSHPHDTGVCTMCGDYCSIKLMEECPL